MLRLVAPLSRRRREVVRRADDGATLMEMVVALMIFAVISSALLTLLLSTARMAGDTKSRSVAASIAASVIDEARAIGAKAVPQGGTDLSRTVSGQRYTVVRDAVFVKRGETSTCSSSGVLSYLRVNVVVSWGQQGSSRSVESDTLLTPEVGDIDATKGNVAVQVNGREDKGMADVTVTLTAAGGAGVPMTQRTTRDGCAMFTSVNPGMYTAALSKDGYTDKTGNATPKADTSVTAGTIAGVKFLYDHGSTARVTLAGADDVYRAPDDLKVTLFSPTAFGSSTATRAFRLTPAPRKLAKEATPTVPVALYPDAGGYGGWAGECSSNAPPEEYAAPQLQTVPGEEAEFVLGVARFEVRRNWGTTVPTAGWTVVATAPAEPNGGCPTGATYRFSAVDPKVVLGALPYGSWTFQIVDKSGRVSAKSAVPLAVGGTVKTVTLVLT